MGVGTLCWWPLSRSAPGGEIICGSVQMGVSDVEDHDGKLQLQNEVVRSLQWYYLETVVVTCQEENLPGLVP